MNLIFIPFAGGTKYSYDFLKKYFDSTINIITLELPGHGCRIREPLLDNLKEIVTDLYINNIDIFRENYIIFGHSMGAVVAFLLTEKLIFAKLRKPLHLILSSHGVIDILSERRLKRYELDYESFKTLVKKFGGIPEEILNHEEAYSIFEKILRADFKALDTYSRKNHFKLNVPITAICGNNDICTYEELNMWSKYTVKDFQSYLFEGEHFYIFSHAKEVADIIKRCIR